MEMSYKLDWIGCTLFGCDVGMSEVSDEAGARAVMARVASRFSSHSTMKIERVPEVVSPYSYAFRLGDMPGRFYVPREILRMGVGYRATGTQLPTFGDGWMAYARLKAAAAKFTRLDYAFDFVGDVENMTSLIILHEEFLAEQRTATVYRKQGKPSGYTLGSRQSDLYMRVYDKALEQGKEGIWIRAELEVKGERVKQFSVALAKAFEFAAKILMDKAIPPKTVMADAMRAAFEDGEVVAKVPPRVKADREKWLWSDVRSSIVKLVRENPDAAIDFVQGVMLIVSMELDAMGHTSLTDTEDDVE